ncbi:MAG: PD-(D/E)XK nuclease family protein [Phycisphaerales bacterium]|nr:PD-(D/E)XK nuclease family protein [Phycisphaerales bacterium]
MVTTNEISLLFNSVQKIIDHQEQLEKLKGERFNIFSVLKMERLENRTHSAFIAELLNPKGSHLKGNIFLSLFLQTISLTEYVEIDTAEVIVEFGIGERNDELKTGGRIDIFIRDKRGKSISIENKIDAGDQTAQVERYYNYNKDNNTVVYLTLDGKEASKESAGNLVAGSDYKIVSYKDDIINWLQLCLKEAADFPLLRESIKQYLNLIKKMTSSPDKQHEKEFINLLVEHYEVAAFVKNNMSKARQVVGDEIRYAVFNRLNTLLNEDEFSISIGDVIHNQYAQIWIWHKNYPNADVYFGVETFNGLGYNYKGKMFVGIFNCMGKANDFTKALLDEKGKYWYNGVDLKLDDAPINFANDELIIDIQKQTDFKDKLIDYIATIVYDFVITNKDIVLTYLKNAANNG